MKLQVNEDTDEVTISLIMVATNGDQPSSDSVESLTLRVPSIEEIGRLQELLYQANGQLPQQPVMPPAGAPREEVEAVLRQGEERGRALRGPTSPYAAVALEMVAMLAGKTVTLAQLPAFMTQPRTFDFLIELWTNPLGGADRRVNEVAEAINSAIMTELAKGR